MLKSVVVGLVREIDAVFSDAAVKVPADVDALNAKEAEELLGSLVHGLVEFVADSPDEAEREEQSQEPDVAFDKDQDTQHEYLLSLEEQVKTLQEQNVKMKAIAMEALFKLRQTIDENGAVVEAPRLVINTNILPFDAFVQRMGLNNRVSPCWQTVQIQQQADRFTVLFPHEVYTDPEQKDACVGFLNRLERHAKSKKFPTSWSPKGFLIIIARRPPEPKPKNSDI